MRRSEGISTITDVARHVGLGTATVSRVLNHQPRVSQRTRARVLEAIEQLGYRPNEAARLLRGRTERLIGVIVPALSDYFLSQCAEGIQRAAQAEGYRVLVACSENNLQTERLEMRRMKERGASGVLVVPCDQSTQWVATSEMSNFPIVALLRPLAGIRADMVVMDQSECTMAAVRQLIGYGHRRIVCIGDDADTSIARERELAFRQVVTAAGYLPRVIQCATTRAAVHAAVAKAVQGESCDALFCLAWQSTMYVVRALQEVDTMESRKIAVAGFDDCGLVELLYPQISTISASTTALAHSGVRQLVKLIRRSHGPTEKGRRIVIPARLVCSPRADEAVGG